MDRREVLKALVLASGTAVIPASFATSTRQMANEANRWFFSADERETLDLISAIIIPKTDTPGASEMKVVNFIDLIFNDLSTPKRQQNFKRGLSYFNVRFKHTVKLPFNQAPLNKRQPFVEELYREEHQYFKAIEQLENSPTDNEETYLYSFLIAMKALVVEGYFTSEYVSEQLMAYDPVPGKYDPNFKVDEDTKVWSATW